MVLPCAFCMEIAFGAAAHVLRGNDLCGGRGLAVTGISFDRGNLMCAGGSESGVDLRLRDRFSRPPRPVTQHRRSIRWQADCGAQGREARAPQSARQPLFRAPADGYGHRQAGNARNVVNLKETRYSRDPCDRQRPTARAMQAMNVETLHPMEIKHAIRMRNFRGMQSFHVIVTVPPPGARERRGVHHHPTRPATIVTPPSGGTVPVGGAVLVGATLVIVDR